ncbi:hypothetical protein D3C86_889070 [compost metagenome]
MLTNPRQVHHERLLIFHGNMLLQLLYVRIQRDHFAASRQVIIPVRSPFRLVDVLSSNHGHRSGHG